MLDSFVSWLRDPFGKKDIRKHNEYINDMYVIKTITERTNQRVLHHQRPRRVMGGANAIDRAVLGTNHHARTQRNEQPNR